jgi:c-di-GMP-binding flagellar brake protein YcgR
LLIDNIKTGDRVEITPMNMKHDTKPFISKVEAVLLDRTGVLIHAPMHAGTYLRLTKDTNYYLQFVTGQGFFKFRARLTEYLVVDGFQVVKFDLLDKGERSQRRDFFRFNCAMPTKFAVVTTDGEDADPNMMDGVIRDLGGGGMKMMSASEVKEKSYIRIMLELNEEYIMVFGIVMHKVKSRDAVLPFQYGIKFAAMSKTDQEKIIQFLYTEQRKALQRAR